MSDHAPAAAEAIEQEIHIDYWEGIWIRVSFAILAIFVVAILVAAFAFNIRLPGAVGRVDPNNLDAPGSRFASANLGAREMAPGIYEVNLVAQTWQFNGLGTPDFDPLTLPAGSEVTFYVTSKDIQHGFKVIGTNVNMMLLPGQISSLRATFENPGTYDVVCHEYCGPNHHNMYGQIVIAALPGEEGEATEGGATEGGAIEGGVPESETGEGAAPETLPAGAQSPSGGTLAASTPQGTPVDATTEPGALPVGTPEQP